MTYHDKSISLAAAAAVVFLGCASPHAGIAQSAGLPDGPIACDAFQRGYQGSWTVLRPATIYPQGVALSLPPGQTFAPNQMLDGFEVTAILDRNCGNR